MSVNLLVRAAMKLRGHAEKAQNKHPWCPGYTWSAVRHVQRNCGDNFECGMHGADPNDECWSFDMYDGRYVALMHPPVALALAEWLEAAAHDAWDMGSGVAAEAVARAILREEP